MGKLFRRAAALLGAVSLGILGLVGYYASALPDFYYVSDDRPFVVSAAFAVTSRPTESKVWQAAYSEGNFKVSIDGKNSAVTKISDRTLMLFGRVPIKNIQTGQVERPKLAVCGQPFGIKLVTDGVMVIELEQVGGSCPASECGICVGDIITSVNGENVTTNKKISELIADSKGKPCEIVYRRGEEQKTATLNPVYSGGSYKAGMWVRDSSAGIGTMTFCDPDTGAFGGLGHPICDSDTKLPLPLSHGTVGEVTITGCNKSEKGDPGQLMGEFASTESLGEIYINGGCGVFGILSDTEAYDNIVELGFRQEAHTGKATIFSSVEGNEPQEYEIEIEKVDLSENAEHDMIVKVTDSRLIKKTGGIVQGMSGSPIIQDGRLIGAVTHVFVDDPTRGYGVFADEMYAETAALAENGYSLAG